METIKSREACPQCHRTPQAWRERPQYGSREIYWIGCRNDGHLASGISAVAAEQNWERMIGRWKFEHSSVKAEAA
jgi:glutaredoxin